MFMFDDDFSGTMSLDEFALLHSVYCQICPFDSAEQMFLYYDTDFDGQLDTEEFARLYEAIDFDGDDGEEQDGDE